MAGACEEVRAGRTKVLEVVADEVRRVTVFSEVDDVNMAGCTEVEGAVVEDSSGSEDNTDSIKVVDVVGVRAGGFAVAVSDIVLDSVHKLVVIQLLAGIVLFRRTLVHRLPRNVVMEDIWRASWYA